MQASISQVCTEPEFKGTAFCACCVPNHYFSIDDTCACKPLVLDADFCFFDPSAGGYPAVRTALVHAASVCANRTVSLPYGGDISAPICSGKPNDAGTD